MKCWTTSVNTYHIWWELDNCCQMFTRFDNGELTHNLLSVNFHRNREATSGQICLIIVFIQNFIARNNIFERYWLFLFSPRNPAPRKTGSSKTSMHIGQWRCSEICAAVKLGTLLTRVDFVWCISVFMYLSRPTIWNPGDVQIWISPKYQFFSKYQYMYFWKSNLADVCKQTV